MWTSLSLCESRVFFAQDCFTSSRPAELRSAGVLLLCQGGFACNQTTSQPNIERFATRWRTFTKYGRIITFDKTVYVYLHSLETYILRLNLRTNKKRKCSAMLEFLFFVLSEESSLTDLTWTHTYWWCYFWFPREQRWMTINFITKTPPLCVQTDAISSPYIFFQWRICSEW